MSTLPNTQTNVKRIARMLSQSEIKASKRRANELTGYKLKPGALLWQIWFRCRTDKASTKAGGCTAHSREWFARQIKCSLPTLDRALAFLRSEGLIHAPSHIFAGKKMLHASLSIEKKGPWTLAL